jgi:hypothetical protein
VEENHNDWEEDDEVEEEAMSMDDTDFQDIISFRDFLLGSNALQTLRTQVQNFILPKPSRLTRRKIGTKENEEAIPSETEDLGRVGSWIARILGPVMRTIDAFLIATGHREPPLQPAKVRLRWKCVCLHHAPLLIKHRGSDRSKRCGENFTSDIMEYEPGGVSEMIAHVTKLTGSEVTSTPYAPSSTNQKYINRRPDISLQSGFTRLAAIFRRSSDHCTLPQHSSNTTPIHSVHDANLQQPKILHLMACMHSGNYGKSLHQDPIDTIDTDRKLFLFLRQQFSRCRGRFCTILSLKRVKSIYFVKFNLFMGGSVEVRHHSHCCDNICECIPPQSRVEPSPQAEYSCKPAGPLKSGPPILPDLLSHYFAHPSCISEQDNSILNRLPKRICGQLQGKIGEPAEGWGIYYQEGWDGDIIMLVAFVMFLVGSLLFGILWSRFKMDIQGAFGVSAYIMTAATLFISLVAIKAGKL